MLALTNCEVEDACIPAVNHSGVEVDWTATPKLVLVVVNGHATPAVGHVVRQESPIKQNTVAEIAVDEAFGNVDAVVLVAVKYDPLICAADCADNGCRTLLP